MTEATRLRGRHAIKLFVSTELKVRLQQMSQALDRPLADVCRTLLWIGLPILEGLETSRRLAETQLEQEALSEDRADRRSEPEDGRETVVQ